jgi:hypothetical protein
MLHKIFLTFVAAIVIGASSISCSEDLPDCPNALCVMSGGWNLVEVQLDGEMYEADLTQYQLTLYSPSPDTETNSTFERVQISGNQDNGTWSIENTNPDAQSTFKGSILRLKPSDNALLQEDWTIESFTPREMVLVLNRDAGAKNGPAKIRFVLVPF